MRLLRKAVDQFGAGDITLKPEHAEDMWAAYNLVAAGDRVTGATYRKLQKVSATGTTSNSRVKMTLTVLVTKVDFEPKVARFLWRSVPSSHVWGRLGRCACPGRWCRTTSTSSTGPFTRWS
jgi:stalled ribosome rescue protein Dom34